MRNVKRTQGMSEAKKRLVATDYKDWIAFPSLDCLEWSQEPYDIILTLGFPPLGSDLHPIENLWDVLYKI